MKYTIVLLIAGSLISGCNMNAPQDISQSINCQIDSQRMVNLIDTLSVRNRLLSTQVSEWKAGKKYENRTKVYSDSVQVSEDRAKLDADRNKIQADKSKMNKDKSQ